MAVITAFDPPDAAQGGLREQYLAFLAAHDDAMTRDCAAGHLTASTLVVDPAAGRVLLTLHARIGRWLQLGGHCEPGDPTLLAAAGREAAEESGIGDLELAPGPVRLDRHRVHGCRSSAGEPRLLDHLDVQYLAVAAPGAAISISAESLALRWWPWDALPDVDPAVAALVARASAEFR